MRGRKFDSAAAVAVLDDGRLVGLATIEQLFAAPHGATIGQIMTLNRRPWRRTPIRNMRRGSRAAR
jgi:ABC-type methionine transport system ATPase subunit